MIQRIRLWSIYVALAVILLAVAVVTYWLVWPSPTFKPSTDPRQILNPGNEVKQGEYIIYQGGGTHYTDGVFVDVYAELVDGFVLQYPPAGYVTQIGERAPQPTAKYIVPCFVPPGTYMLKITSIFRVNPLREEILTVTTEPFQVVASDACKT